MDILKMAYQQQLEEYHGVNRFLSASPVIRLDCLIKEVQIEDLFYPPVKVGLANYPFQSKRRAGFCAKYAFANHCY